MVSVLALARKAARSTGADSREELLRTDESTRGGCRAASIPGLRREQKAVRHGV